MRYRRFGATDLEVSEVGFGTWTLASNWWGEVADKQGLLRAALDAGINFIDTAPVYGDDAIGETLLADVLKTNRDDIVVTTKGGYEIKSQRRFPGQSERPQDWSPAGVRRHCEESLARMEIETIDLYQLHNARLDPILDDDLWAELTQLRAEGKVRELGVALGPAIGWVEEGISAVDVRPIASLQTVFNILEQEPGLSFAARPRVADGSIGMIARVPHASDTLSGKITPETTFPAGDHRAHRNPDNMADNFEKAETLSFLWGSEAGRTQGQAAIVGILANPAFTTVLPTVTDIDYLREYAAATEYPLTAAETSRLGELWARNFDHEDRFEMPMKSSRDEVSTP